MNHSNPSSSKKQHYNRFAYLLQSVESQQKPKTQKEYNFFDLNTCVGNPCSNKNIHQIEQKEQSVPSRLQQQTRKPLKYQLQSKNYQLFKQQIEQKSSLNSFIAYTPEKSQDKGHFTINNNDLSTIQYTKSNEMHTHRNLFESIFQERFPIEQFQEKEQTDLRMPNTAKPFVEKHGETNLKGLQHDLIRLQLSSSDEDDESQKVPVNFIKKHMRTMTEQLKHTQKSNIISTAQKSARNMHLNLNLQSQSNKFVEPSKKQSTQSSLMDEVKTFKKSSNLTIATLKTKQMSQKLQQSSDLEFQNSVCLTQIDFRPLSVKGTQKSIQLGRKNHNNKKT